MARSKAFKAESGTRTQVTGGDYEGKVGEVIAEDESGQFRVSLDGTQETVLVESGDLGAISDDAGAPEDAPEDEPAEPDAPTE